MPKEVAGIGLMYEVSELAQVLGVAESTILRYWKIGRLPGQKVGAYTYFTADAVKRFLEGSNENKKHVAHKAMNPTESDKAGAKPRAKKAKSIEQIRNETDQVKQIHQAMKETGNNKTQAAKLLGWPDRTFRERYSRFKLSPKLIKPKQENPVEPESMSLFKE